MTLFLKISNIFRKDKVLTKNKYFEIIERKNRAGESLKFVCLRDDSVKSCLSQFFHDNEAIYDNKPIIEIEEFFTQLDRIEEYNEETLVNSYGKDSDTVKGMKKLHKCLKDEFQNAQEAINTMLKDEKISFKYLWYIFKPGVKFVSMDRFKICKVGSIVQNSGYKKTFLSTSFKVNGTVVYSTGKGFVTFLKSFNVDYFKGVKRVRDLPLYPITEKDKEYTYLEERGRVYAELSLGSHYKDYVGNCRVQNRYFANSYRADGRVMIDSGCFIKMNPGYSGLYTEIAYEYQEDLVRGRRGNEHQQKKFQKLSEDQYFICGSFVFGFSFKLKKWAEFQIDLIKEIEFNDKAFDALVLDEEKKKLIKCLVVNDSKTATDVIQNKGGGSIFLLYGPPGTGKTLTAESISELLHRPLYSCSIGELGTNATYLERTLQDILEICKIWNAVILIDEADIFLEARNASDIERNGMVGIFLRLLEYYDGVLFLTTNRVECFDEAFQSRISIAFEYKKLDSDSRKKVWLNLLNFFEFDYSDLDIEALKEYDLNGRNIRCAIILASKLTQEKNDQTEKYKLLMKDIISCVKCVTNFKSKKGVGVDKK